MIKNKFQRFLATILLVFALLAALTFAPSLALKRLPQAFPVAHGQNVSPAPTAMASAPGIDKAELYQALLDLTNPFTVMCVAAHPDDEDGTSLIVMRRKYGAHTVSLFSTFGEGGQNAIGPELYEEMGAIRARETMAAAEIQGSEPHFLGLKDFGFSKSAEEAFRFWGHDEALRRMVLQIRKLSPDVIITNHNTTSGHGHHQATGRLELEAFDAAADPKRFPEQLKDGVKTWQVQRLFLRVGFGNQLPAENGGTVTIDPNERDSVRGTIFAEEALRALQKHATQGPWPRTFEAMLRGRNLTDGKLPLIRYVLAREAKGADALPKDSHNFLEGLRLSEKTAKLIELPSIEGRPVVDFIEDRPKVLKTLLLGLRAGLYGFSDDKSDQERLLWMRARLERAISVAAGITLQTESSRRVAAPGSTFEFTRKLSNTSAEKVSVSGCSRSLATKGGDSLDGVDLAGGKVMTSVVKVAIPHSAPINLPLSAHLYDPSALGLQLNTRCLINLPGGYFNLNASTPIDVAPSLEITPVSPVPIVRTPAVAKSTMPGSGDCVLRDFDFTLRVTNNQDASFSGQIVVDLQFRGKPAPRIINIPAHGKVDLVMPVTACALSSGKPDSGKPESVTFTVVAKGAMKPVARLDVPVVWTVARIAPSLRVGYIRGFDYSLPNALAALGVESKELSVDEVKTADLQKYSTILVDNRVYESQPELIAANQKLLDYAKEGGTLVVFYHKSNEWNPDARRNRPSLAPYKLILGDARITDETAPVTFIEPQHPLLNVPNKMGQEDFANWIQERGLYYPRDWDPQYHALLQSNDPGEGPLKGGLLVADYGRGHYIYSSMVWYRQLRAGVPGAYRMFANMISYGKVGP